MQNKWQRIFKGAAIGSVVGAVVLFFFGDGFLMAFGLALEGAIFGCVVGIISAMVIAILSKAFRS